MSEAPRALSKNAVALDGGPASPPLVVDLDGTLIKSDMLYESLWKLVCKNPLYVSFIPFWLSKGKANLKRQIARRVSVDVRTLPYREAVLTYLRSQRAQGRTLVLATASDELIAQQIAMHLGLFETVIASDGEGNMKGRHKAAELERRFGTGGFCYVANGWEDLPVWEISDGAVVVSNDKKLADRVMKTTHVETVLEHKKEGLRPFFKALRLHQWFKNVLVLVPLVAAHRVADPAAVAQALLAFLAFGLVASAGYLVNDLVDIDADRRHHSKKHRPFASGALDVRVGFIAAPALFVIGAILGLMLPTKFLLVLIGYFAVSQLYSFYLKRIVLADVFVLALLYTARIIAGAAAIAVPTSQWLLAFSVFLFLSLAFVKRYSELYSLRQEKKELAAGRGYLVVDFEMLSGLGAASGYIAVLVLALYINSPEVRVLYRSPEYLWLFCLILLYWVSRVWLIAHRGRMHDDPIVYALRDPVSHVVAAVCILSIVLALA